jgi:proline racemase
LAPSSKSRAWALSRWTPPNGGDSFVIVDAHALGFRIAPDEARELAETGVRITRAANEQLGFMHPINGEWDHISFCRIAAPVERRDGQLTAANAVVVRPGKIDRSPTGTGASARMAVMRARGEMQVGDNHLARSIIGSAFLGRIEADTRLRQSGDHPIDHGARLDYRHAAGDAGP